MTYPLAASLEAMARASITALNERNFSPNSPLFTNKLPTWTSEARDATDNREMNLQEYAASMQQYIHRWPDFRVDIVDVQTSVDEKNGFAEMFLRTQTSGNPPGIFKRSVTNVVFRRVNGRWFSAGHRAVPGSEVGGGE